MPLQIFSGCSLILVYLPNVSSNCCHVYIPSVSALDLCVALMDLDEVAEVMTEAEYAYGAHGK